MCHVSCVMSYVSYVLCPISYIMGYVYFITYCVSFVMCHVSFFSVSFDKLFPKNEDLRTNIQRKGVNKKGDLVREGLLHILRDLSNIV